MIRKFKTALPIIIALSLYGMNTFAQAVANAPANESDVNKWKFIAAAFAMAIAAAGCAMAQGKGLAAACSSTARNPQAGGRIFTMMILGLAFIETMALLTFVVTFVKILAN